MSQHEPCITCPWRKSSKVGGFDIPNFKMEMMRGLSNTVGNGDAFRPIMACHYSACGEESSCRGYIAQEGYSNLNVRIMASKRQIAIREIMEACKPMKLWPSFRKMLAAYEKANKKAEQP